MSVHRLDYPDGRYVRQSRWATRVLKSGRSVQLRHGIPRLRRHHVGCDGQRSLGDTRPLCRGRQFGGLSHA